LVTDGLPVNKYLFIKLEYGLIVNGLLNYTCTQYKRV